ncbi:E3 ubiquitin-protein ligase RNF25 isoform X2 [Spea bombifrons]|uniref:E3 ubiquitin-protein ligase RNF25 isoform X2 n=1 Tax=Spea bombifrons TaxID=233779 RepID=UPI00234979B9|nr:E3 ubiquitin-protein ligase RNF25 isoform X2 [Spea bombifrons]
MAEEDAEGSLSQELEVLESIYLDELEICRGERSELSITLHPATGDDADSQYVKFTLRLSLPPRYPVEPPEVSVSRPRGLRDEHIQSIIRALNTLATENVGHPILYELIEGKEMLTASNIPHGQCAVCLYDFQDGDCLTKTQCFHHFHSHCLGRYADHCQKHGEDQEPLVFCPVCRENLTGDLSKLLAAPPPQHPEVVYVADAHTLQKAKELHRIYMKQVAKGGIIDLEAEKNRFFISIQEPPAGDGDHALPCTEEVPVPPSEEHLPGSVLSKQPCPRELCGQHSAMSRRHVHRDKVSRERMWQSRAKSETSQAQYASHRVATRDPAMPANGRSQNRGPRTFRPRHPCSGVNNI